MPPAETRQGRPKGPVDLVRAREMHELNLKGWSYAKIGESYGITKQAAHSQVSRYRKEVLNGNDN